MSRFSDAALSLPGFKGRIDSGWNTPSVLNVLADCRTLLDAPETTILLRSRNTVASVWLPRAPGQKVPAVLKAFGMRGVNRLKSLFLPSKAAKAWRGAGALVERGINTAPPIAYLESRRRGFIHQSYFLAGRLDGVREIRFLLRELQGEALDRLLGQAAVFLAACHDQGIIHRDLSDGNILVRAEDPGRTVFYLLDTNRVRVKGRVGPWLRMKNLVRLGVPAERRDFFLDQYSRGKSLPGRYRWWYKFQKAVYTGRVNLKKRLRLRKIARKLGVQ